MTVVDNSVPVVFDIGFIVDATYSMNPYIEATKETILKITKEMNEKCTICMIEMNEDEEYLDIECKHIFHKDCLETYLKNYNHICPVCRKDIGKSYAHITD